MKKGGCKKKTTSYICCKNCNHGLPCYLKSSGAKSKEK